MSLQRLLEGWALFEEGAWTGKKHDPSDAFRNRRTHLGTDRKKVFTPNERLSPLQIPSVFPCLASHAKKVTLAATDDIAADDEDDSREVEHEF